MAARARYLLEKKIQQFLQSVYLDVEE